MKELTKAEEQLMLILWQLKEAFIKDIIDRIADGKPAYTTVASVLRVLEGKGFVDHKTLGNMHFFFPLITEEAYRKFAFEKIVGNYFNNSYQKLASFLVQEKNIDIADIEELKRLAEQIKK